MVQLFATPSRRCRDVLGVILIVLAVGFSGCGGDDDGDAGVEPADADASESAAPAESDDPDGDAGVEPEGVEPADADASESAAPAESDDPSDDPAGVSDDRILFGQSAALSGPAQQLGSAMKLGIEAAFHEQNQAGGVHGRQLELIALDDLYEPEDAYSNTLSLIDDEGVFALIGEVGTPTSRSVYPLAHARGVPFVAPFTGAEFLRDVELSNVVNLRASYYQETEQMVARLTEDLGITKIAVLYQNDSYGQAGLSGVRLALERRDLEPVASWYYRRNTNAVKRAVYHIVKADPEAVIMIGAYSPVAETVKLIRQDIDPVFMAVSFVGSNALVEELGSQGAGVYVTQVVPLPWDTDVPAVAAYQAALEALDAPDVPSFVSLEGYLAGRLAIKGLELCGPDVSRQCFLKAIQTGGVIDLEGLSLEYGAEDNQGSDAVYLTVIGTDGKYHQVTQLGGVR